jgi:translation elongation factor EF-1beta
MIVPSTSYAAQIMGKYGIQRFGLSALKWQVMMNEKGVKDEVQQQMKRILYGN